MSSFDICVGELDLLGSVSLRFRPKDSESIRSGRVIAESFEQASECERGRIVETINSTLAMKLLVLSGYLAEAAINANDESIVRVATLLHVVEDFRNDCRENCRYLVLIAFASQRVGADFRSVVSSLDRVGSDRSKKCLSDFLSRDESLNRLESFGVKDEVVGGLFRFSPL